MKMSDVEATESGASRAEDSKARAQHAGYGARPGGRPRRPGRATASFEKKDLDLVNALGAEGQSLTVLSCLPHLHKHYFMLNYSHQVYDPAERFPAELRSD